MPTITGGHHVAFTVRDADRSAQWDGDLPGTHVVLKGDDDTAGPGSPRLGPGCRRAPAPRA